LSLLQSHVISKKGPFIIDLLPALPASWPSGEVKGLVARGGFVVDIKWENSQLVAVKIQPRLGGSCTVSYKGNRIELTNLKAGEKYELNEQLKIQ
jgi:alpha-L-fucosidase 2